MTNSPPPQIPPPGTPPPRAPERRAPGFIVCGLAVFAGFVVVGGIGSAISEGFGNIAWVNAAISFSIIAGLIMMSIRDIRFGKCLVKGIVVVVAVFGALAGACIALLAGSGL